MRIKELEIDNFKSFRSKTTIPFLDGFTTISGPNGSGKSNIIDCILFALGLSSSRTLRAEKLTDLINNNNQRREATVKIIFSDDNNPGKEFEIKRKIKEGPNGYASTYYLNGHVSTLSEIHNTLSTYNVSPGCFNVMMQGDVTGIINMSPNERRKIIDELAGVAEFDRRIEQAIKEIDTVQDRIERSTIILGEIDVRISQLAQERDQALKYQKLKEEKQHLINQISLVKYTELKKSLKLIQENIHSSTKEKSELENNLINLETKIAEAKQLLDTLNQQVKIKGEDEQINLTKQSEILKGEIFRKEQTIEFAQKQIDENKHTTERAYKEINNLNETIDDTQLKIENKQEQYKIIEAQLQKENDEFKRLIEESGDLTKTAQTFIEKRNKLRKELESLEDGHSRLTRENLKWEDIANRLKNELQELEADLNNSDENKISLSERKEKLIKEISYLNEEKSACEVQANNTLNSIKELKSKISDIDSKIQKNYRHLMQLEANQKANEEMNFGRSIDTILNSGIPGIHKTLVQLGKVDREYTTALEIAMGGRMKSIVVDNEHVASEAINYLKQRNAGRATFLPLNKISYYVPTTKLPNADGVIDFAINLIEFDSIYKNAFFYALGETLIVDTIESAKPLMGAYRMVTLDGSLVEKTGAMTGGSINNNNTLKFSNNYNEEIKEYSKTVKELNNDKDLLLENLSEAERKMERTRQDYSNYLTQLHQKKFDLENVENTLKNIDGTLQNKVDRVKEINTKLNEAELERFSIEEELDETCKNIEHIKNSIQETDSSIPADKLEQIEELTGNIEFEIKNLESKLRNLEAEIKKISMEKEFKQQSLDYQKEKIEQCKTDNIKLEEEKEKTVNEIQVIQAKVNELNDKISSLSTELKELQKQRDSEAKSLFELQQSKDQKQNNILRIEESIIAYNQHKNVLTNQMKELIQQLKEENIDYSRAFEVNTTTEEINRAIERLTRRMESLEPVNMLAIKEYEEVQNRKDELSTKINTLTKEKDEVNNRLNGYENMKKQSFMMTFENVNENFKKIFSDLSDGEGYLVLENPEEPFKGGLTIEAKPRGKKLLRIEAMSGGEKSLTALAFVFAFQRYLPAPFYAFDEVDMFLDGVNVEKLAQMIKEQSSNAQFIVVSLRKPMLEKADRTVGVTQRNDGISKVTGVALNA